ncbi:hypothetical protein ED92_40220 [Amycolatopsis sp. MJM2582]|nr:hypothetical protein ED92_40220 [Amycolatopsis sp. MJM2582]
MQIADGFRIAKVLAVALELEIFANLRDGGTTTAEEFSERYRIHRRPARMLLAACASLGLLDRVDGRYRNSAISEEFLVPGKRYYFGDLVRFTDRREYGAWDRLEWAIRNNRPTTWDPDSTEETDLFSGDGAMLDMFWSMLSSGAMYTARSLAASFDFRPYDRLLDVGGAAGAFCIELCSHYSRLEATVYDLEFVCEGARKAISEAGLSDRIDTHAGDFFQQELPSGYDLMLLSNVLHDWGEGDNRKLLGKCHAALADGGTLLIAESFVNDDETGPVAGAISSLNMLIETTEGQNYTRAEYTAWLTEAGFIDVRTAGLIIDAPGANGLLVAQKGGK